MSTLSKGYHAIRVKSMFKAKKNAKGDVKRYEASLFANGYKIKYGINYEELFVKKINIQWSKKAHGYKVSFQYRAYWQEGDSEDSRSNCWYIYQTLKFEDFGSLGVKPGMKKKTSN